MQWCRLVLGLSLLVGSLTPSSSFVLHKRHAPSKEDNGENRLAQALNVIARERRRLRDEDTWRGPEEPSPVQQQYEGPYQEQYGYDDPAIQQLLASLLEGGEPQGYQGYYGADEGYNGPDLSPYEGPEENYGGLRGQYMSDADFAPSYAEEAYGLRQGGPDVEEEEEEEEAPEAQPTSQHELQEIFQPSDEEGQEEEEEEDGGEGEEDDEEGMEKKSVLPIFPMVPMVPGQKRGGVEGELTEDQVRQLLEDAEEQEVAALRMPQPAGNQEIQDILSPGEDEGGEDQLEGDGQGDGEPDLVSASEEEENGMNTETDDEESDDVIQENNGLRPQNKEWPLEQYLAQGNRVHVKRKRSGRDPVELRGEELDMELDMDELQLENKILRRYLDFEDDQNEKLMQALDLATKGQLRQTDRFIGQEVNLIKDAIGDEEMLQVMRESLGDEEEGELEEPLMEVEESEELMGPLGDEVIEEEDEELGPYAFLTGVTDQDEQDEEKRSGGDVYEEEEPLEEETQRALARRLAAQLYSQLWRSNIAQENDVMEPADEVRQDDEEEQWYDRPINEDMEGLEDEELEMNPFLRDLWRRYQEERANTIAEDALEPEFMSEDEPPGGMLSVRQRALGVVCPALAITEGCSWAYSEQLMLDPEARDLCNRHQLCYLCGAAHGLTEEDCDAGYTSEAAADCTESEAICEMEVLELYTRMRRHHRYIPEGLTHHTCAYQCTANYIVGPQGKK